MDLQTIKGKIETSCPGILSDDNLGTKKYKHIQSWEVVESFHRLGYEVVSWDMQRSKRNGKHAPHIVEMVSKKEKFFIGNDMVHPQVIILNSYNAKQALRIKFGIFYSQSHKMSLTVGDALEGTRIVHMGSKVDELVNDIHEDISKRMTSLKYENYMKPLTDEERKNLCKKILAVRFGSKSSGVSVEAMLQPINEGDVVVTAWDCYQLVTERLLRGLYIINRTTENGYKHVGPKQGTQIKKFTVSGYWQEKLLKVLKEETSD